MALRGLLIREPFVGWVLDGKKTWEIRGIATRVRERIALIAAGTGTIVGTCELVDVVGPLTRSDLVQNVGKLNLEPSDPRGPMPYSRTYAWILARPKRLSRPLAYCHPQGP
jgi:hypothetical protein